MIWRSSDNHYHLLVETPKTNLTCSLRHLEASTHNSSTGNTTEWGNLFQGRYKAILMGKETHLKTLCRYVVLNPREGADGEEPKGICLG
jgi:hypothetical protein